MKKNKIKTPTEPLENGRLYEARSRESDEYK